jgi:hypothetical protein
MKMLGISYNKVKGNRKVSCNERLEAINAEIEINMA